MTTVEKLKISLKNLVAEGRADDVLRRLREDLLYPQSDLYNDTVLTEAKYRDSQRAGTLGLIDLKDGNIQFANINQALLWLIDRIDEGSLKPTEQLVGQKGKQHKFYPSHQYTANRSVQFNLFEPLLDDGENARIHYFYLHGGEAHKHESLFKRFVNRTKGEEKPTGYTVVDIAITNIDSDIDLNRLGLEFSKAVLRDLGNPECNWPKLPNRSLVWGIANGEQTHKLDKNGKILFHLSITDAHWDADMIPQQARSFILNFCEKEPLPADAPEVFFFFSIEYNNDHPSINKEIEAAMSEASLLTNMGELQMVTREDIEKWFKKYRQKWDDDEEREATRKDHFDHEPDTLYMKKVERKLGKIINNINESDNYEKR